jgi:protein-disulfide isomerase
MNIMSISDRGASPFSALLRFTSAVWALFAAVAILTQSVIAAGGNAAGLDHGSAAVSVTASDPFWGQADAPVTIVEFADFECPFSGRVEATLAQIKSSYGPEKVRIVWKNNPLPFHAGARPAADAAMAMQTLGGNLAFWKFHDTLFQNQRYISEDKFNAWATAAGVDASRFKAAYGAKQGSAKVEQDMALAKTLGVVGTPAFRINGVEVMGAQPFEKFKEVIDQELIEAQKLVTSGTSRAQVYLVRTKHNLTAKPPSPQQKPEPVAEDTTLWKVPIFSDDPVLGANDALVTIVEFGDFQCPFSKRVETTLKQILDKYGHDVRLVWKDNPLPFHDRALPSSVLARVALQQNGSRGFWAAHHALFASQPKLGDQDLKSIARKLGLSWSRVDAAIEQKQFKAKLDASADLATDFNVRGTPQFFINGYRVSGSQPFEKFKEVIDQQLSKARGLVSGGIAKDRIYDAAMRDAKVPPPPEQKQVPLPTAQNPVKGAPKAKVSIQIFGDFECPFCMRSRATLAQVAHEYPNDVKFVWRNMPLEFHPNAALAAEAALEVFAQKGAVGFWKYHDQLFESAGNLSGIKRDMLEKLARQLGCDMAKFKQALDSHRHKAKVDADLAVAKKAGIGSIPTFLINDYYISGAQPYAVFKRLIERAMKASN